MKFFATSLSAGLIAITATGSPFAPLERTVSASRQFLVFGTNPQLRGAIAETAEQVKANFLVAVNQPDQWKTPIVLNLQFPQANIPDTPAAALYFSQTGSGLKLQLDLVIDSDVRASRVEREILRAILLERMYRARPDLPAGTAYVQPPDWLLDGLLAAAPGQNRTPLVDALSPFLAANNLMPLEDFLRQRRELLDSPARVVYQACSLALVELLRNPTGGGPRLADYIDHLCDSPNDQLATLLAKFPNASATDLDRMWQESIRRLHTALQFGLLTFAQTESRLEEALKIPGRDPKKATRLEDFIGKKLSRTEKSTLIATGNNLALLATTANPIMRPIVTEYLEITQLAAAGRHAGLTSRLGRVKSTRTRLIARMSDVDDYLNWFEATQLKTRSDLFDAYLRSASESDTRESRRRDAISVYLDALEEQMEN